VFAEAITKIDLSAPGSMKYRDWLEGYCAEPYATREDLKALEWASERLETNPKQLDMDAPKQVELEEEWGPDANILESGRDVTETWQAMDWYDDWEIELYSYNNGLLGKQVLRTREKTTGEKHTVVKVLRDLYVGNPATFEIVSVGRSYVLYRAASYDGTGWYYVYSPGQDEPQGMGEYGSMTSGFLDAERTKWWHQGYGILYYTDLRKLAAGEADAVREVAKGKGLWFSNAWIAQRDGQSVICYVCQSPIPDDYQHYMGFYDLLEDKALEDVLALPPPLGYTGIVQIHPDIFYLFDYNQALAYFKKGDEIDWDRAEKQGIGAVDFYVINL